MGEKAKTIGNERVSNSKSVCWFGLHCLLLLTLVVGCQTPPRVVYFTHALATNDVFSRSAIKLVDETPIIDIHTHNFNGHDIPVENIALGRRDAFPPWTWLVTDEEARLLAAAIVAETEPENEIERALHHSKTESQRAMEVASLMQLNKGAVTIITNRAPYSATAKALHYATNREMPVIGFKESIVLRSIASFSSHKYQGFLGKGIRDILQEVSPFLADLTLADVKLTKQYWRENSTNVHFRVVHMMDMGPTYGQEPTNGEMRPFEEQIQYMAELQRDPRARMTYFVAYNPFRDNSHPGEAIRIVEDAIKNHHAYGVKLYPPAGYRPTSNSIPRRPWTLFTRQPGLQWDYRYEQGGVKISNAELDHRLLTLLCWCASNDVPVFVHSGYGEFQARSGYGQNMPNPRWWKDVLDNASPQHPELIQLRLCFGHAGGADSFFGVRKYRRWSETVVDLCRRYPNIYCEVGCLDEILDTEKQAVFAKTMDELCRQPADIKHPYTFHSKIMYGSDWFMPITGGVDRHDFLNNYQRVFLLPELRDYYRQFFLDNALAYLNAKVRVNDSQFAIDPVTKSELQQLLSY